MMSGLWGRGRENVRDLPVNYLQIAAVVRAGPGQNLESEMPSGPPFLGDKYPMTWTVFH